MPAIAHDRQAAAAEDREGVAARERVVGAAAVVHDVPQPRDVARVLADEQRRQLVLDAVHSAALAPALPTAAFASPKPTSLPPSRRARASCRTRDAAEVGRVLLRSGGIGTCSQSARTERILIAYLPSRGRRGSAQAALFSIRS